MFGPCTPANLTAHSGEFGMGAGSSWHSIVVTNTGTEACTLDGGPSRLVGIRADGSTKTLATSAFPASSGNLIGPANLQPGQSAQVEVITSMNCPASQAGNTDEYAGVGIGVGAGEVKAQFTGDMPLFDAICGASVTGFGVPSTATDVVSSPLDVLTASVVMPAQVTAGATVTYQVTLANPTAMAVPLSPCPSYDEFMTSAGTPPADKEYYLNCAAVSQIPAGGSVTFDIEVPAPDAAGQAKFGWSLQATSVTAGGVTTVTSG